MLKVDDVLEILSIPLLGIIPESEEVLRASNVGAPVTFSTTPSAPARAYFDAARPPQRRDPRDDGAKRQKRFLRQDFWAEGGMNIISFFKRPLLQLRCAKDRLKAVARRMNAR